MSRLSSENNSPSDESHHQRISWSRRLRRKTSQRSLWSATLWAFLLVPTILTGVNANIPSVPPLQQLFRRTPDNQTATVGDTVTLACSVLQKAGILQWTRDGFGLGTERNLQGYERYRMSGSEEEGDYTLVIDHVTLEDDAVFQCQVSPGPPDSGIRELRSADAKLTIEVPTGAPQILQGDLLQTTEDREITLECISRAGKPAAEITWIDGMGQEVKTGVETIKEPLDDGKRFNTRSTLRFRPKKEHHNKTFTCQAHNRPAKEVMSAFIRLEVKYAPKVSVKIKNSKIYEFETVEVTCKAEANPPDMTFRWFRNDQVIAGDHGTLLRLHNVTRKFHDSIIKCEVQNSVGKSEESETLQIFYGPVFRNRPKNVEADQGSTVTLSCDVDGNPTPEIVWFHEPTQKVCSTSPNLTTIVTEDTQGKYVCQAVVQGFSKVSAVATIFLKGQPKIDSLTQKVQYGVEGELVTLECNVRSIPRPDRITWIHLGREIDNHDPEYTIYENPWAEGIKSSLVIRSAQEKDFGLYNCSATNAYGSPFMEIYLVQKKSGHLVIILTCVIGGVVLIVAVTMITLLCQRKAKKPDLMEIDGVEKQTKQSDHSSNDSDLKVEIRTASSLSNIPEHDSEHWDEGSEALKNESIYRYSDYIDPVFPPKHDGHNNNGYVPYVDYSRDYNPPTSRSLYNGGSGHHVNGGVTSPHGNPYLNNVDPRYSATYGNPYLRTSNSSLPPPHSGGGGNSPNSHPLAHLSHGLHNHLNNQISHNQIGTPTTSAGPPPFTSSTTGSTSPHSHNNPLSNSTNPYGMRNGGVAHHRGSSTPSPQYIVPSQSQLKPGTLATHV